MSSLLLPGAIASMSYLLTAYWLLAAGAALLALVPVPGTSSFRCVHLPFPPPPTHTVLSLWIRGERPHVAHLDKPLTMRSMCRAAVRLTACRGKLWEDRPHVKWLGLLAVRDSLSPPLALHSLNYCSIGSLTAADTCAFSL